MINTQPHANEADAKNESETAPKVGKAKGRKALIIFLAILIIVAMATWIGFLAWGAFTLLRGFAT